MTKVLIFETDRAFAVELRTELSALDCTVQVFKEGNTGLMAAANSRPDLILVSAELPRMNGFSVCNKLKKDPSLANIPLIIMSSQSSEATFAHHMKLRTRAEDYVRKPIAFADLLERISRLIALESSLSFDDATVQSLDDDDALIEFDDAMADNLIDSQGDAVTLEAIDSAFLAAVVGGQARSQPLKLDLDSQSEEGGYPVPPGPLDLSAAQRGPGDTQISEPLGEDDDDDDDDAAPTRPPGPLPDQIALGVAPPPTLPRGAAGATGRGAPSIADAPTEDEQSAPQFLQYGLGEEDEEEETVVGARQLTELRSEERRSERRPRVWSPSDDPAKTDNLDQLRTQLTQARKALHQAQQELTQIRPAATESPRLRAELQSARNKLAAKGGSAGPAGREILELREALQQRDKNVLNLREQLAAKDREMLEARDEALTAERNLGEWSERVGKLEKRANEATARLDAASADKKLADKRAADFRTGAKKIADQLNQRATELRELRATHEQAIQSLEQAHEQALRQTDGRFRDELSDTEAAHQSATEKLKAELAKHKNLASGESKQLADAVEAERKRHAEELQAKEAALKAAEDKTVEIEWREQAEQGRVKDLEGKLAQQTTKLETAEARLKSAQLQQKTTALEHDKALADTADQHARALDAQGVESQKKLTALRAEHEQAAEELQKENAEALQKAGYELQEKLLQKDASFKSIKEQLDQDRTEMEEETAALREQLSKAESHAAELEAEAKKLNETVAGQEQQLAEAQKQHESSKQQLESSKQQLEQQLEKARKKWGKDRKALASARDALSVVVSQLGHTAKQQLDEE